MGKVTTGTATEYPDNEAAALEARVAEAMEDLDDDQDSGSMTVTADVEWAGSYNPQVHRTTTLTGLDLTGVREAVANHRSANADAARLGRASAPTLGVADAVRQVFGSNRAAATALGVTIRTVQRWVKGDSRPKPGHAARLTAAVQQQHTDRVADAKAAAGRSRRAVADAVSAAISDRYGAEVRLFNITDLHIN